MRPVLKTTDVEYEELEYRLTTLPGLITILAGFIGIGCQYLVEYFTGTYQIEEFSKFTASQYTFRILYMLLWFVFGTYIYHTIHQLRMIDLIYTRYTRINLFQMKTIYTFSNLSALTAFGMALLPIGFLLVNSHIMWSDPIVFIVVFIVQLIALLTFIWPQLGIHRQQTVEKERLLEEANQRYVAVINLLHKKVDTNSLENVNLISATLSSLEAELKRLEKIPTWPWQPETLRMLITALAFPLGLWLIQLLLQRLFIQ